MFILQRSKYKQVTFWYRIWRHTRAHLNRCPKSPLCAVFEPWLYATFFFLFLSFLLSFFCCCMNRSHSWGYMSSKVTATEAEPRVGWDRNRLIQFKKILLLRLLNGPSGCLHPASVNIVSHPSRAPTSHLYINIYVQLTVFFTHISTLFLYLTLLSTNSCLIQNGHIL